MTLDELRRRLDSIDNRLLELLEERAALIPKIVEAKRGLGVSAVDPERERALLDRVAARGAGSFPKEAVRAVFREILSGSVSLQSEVKVAYLGPAGTYTHFAARSMFGYAPQYIEEATITAVIDAVSRRRATYGVVPLENSTEGSVASAIDALLASTCKIRRELVLPIEHCLMSKESQLSAIERVYSHPQALAQCRDWLFENLPQAQLIQTSSTALAVQEASGDDAGAAIGSPLASELYGLPVVRDRIQDQDENATRFVMVATEDARPTGDDRTTVAFAMSDDQERGSLRRVLGAFEAHRVNLSRIESRPRRGDAWRYVFIVDADGHRDDEPVAAALADLRKQCRSVEVLGSYPRAK